jgi:hypothetical protein
MRRLTLNCAAIFLFTNLANAQQTAPLSAGEIIHRVSEVYASCTSYLDEGKEEVKSSSHGGLISHSSFTTAFVRPANFRFEESATQSNGEKRHSSPGRRAHWAVCGLRLNARRLV